MYTLSAPGGRASISVRSSNPDPKRRFVVTISDGFCVGTDGLREVAKFLKSTADSVDKGERAAKKAAVEAAKAVLTTAAASTTPVTTEPATDSEGAAE